MSRRQIQAGIEFIENQRVFLTTRGTTANQVNVYHSAPSMSQVMFNQHHHNHKDIKL
jgi:threonine aldolase